MLPLHCRRALSRIHCLSGASSTRIWDVGRVQPPFGVGVVLCPEQSRHRLPAPSTSTLFTRHLSTVDGGDEGEGGDSEQDEAIEIGRALLFTDTPEDKVLKSLVAAEDIRTLIDLLDREQDEDNEWSMEVTCQSLVTIYAIWLESSKNVLLPDSAVDGVIESITRWDKLEALLQSALKCLPKMPDNVVATVFYCICRIGVPMTHPLSTEIFIRLKRRVDELDIKALSLTCTTMKYFWPKHYHVVPVGISFAIDRVSNIMESVTSLEDLERLATCIDVISYMSGWSQFDRFERKVSNILDSRTKSLDDNDVYNLVRVAKVLRYVRHRNRKFLVNGPKKTELNVIDCYDNIHKILQLIDKNTDKLKQDQIHILYNIAMKANFFAPLTIKLQDLQWEAYQTLRDAHYRRDIYRNKLMIFSRLLLTNNPNVTADETKSIVTELRDTSSDAFKNLSFANAASKILRSYNTNTRDAKLIFEKLEMPIFNELSMRQRGGEKLSLLVRHSLEYISSSHTKVRRPHLFISHLSIILRVPGAAASISRETLDRSLSLISSMPTEYLMFLFDSLGNGAFKKLLKRPDETMNRMDKQCFNVIAAIAIAIDKRVDEILASSADISLSMLKSLMGFADRDNVPLLVRCGQEVLKIIDNEELSARERVRRINHVIHVNKSITLSRLGIPRRGREKLVDLVLQCGPNTQAQVLFRVLKCIDDEGDLCQLRELLEMCELALMRDWRYTQIGVGMALRLARHDVFSPELAKTVFSKEFMKNLDRQLALGTKISETRVRSKLCDLNRLVCIKYPQYGIPWFHEKYCQEESKYILGLGDTSVDVEVRSDILTHLQRAVGGPGKVREKVFTKFHHFLDFEVAMDVESGLMLPIATEGDKMAVVPRSGKPEGGESGTTRFGVFLVKNHLYSHSKPFITSKVKELGLLGYKAIPIVVDEWNAMNMQVDQEKMKEKFFTDKFFVARAQDTPTVHTINE